MNLRPKKYPRKYRLTPCKISKSMISYEGMSVEWENNDLTPFRDGGLGCEPLKCVLVWFAQELSWRHERVLSVTRAMSAHNCANLGGTTEGNLSSQCLG